jgi:hypothetical protein
MASLIRIPCDLRTPEQTGIAGNSFWTVQSGTVSQMGFWAFLGNTSGGSGTGIKATGGIIYGYVQVPPNVDPGSVGKLILALGASATSAALTVFRVGTKEVQTGLSFDAPSWVNENAQQWTAPATAWARHDLSFTLTSATTANAMLAIKIERDSDGTSGTENMTALVGCFDVFLEITATA